MLKLFVGLLFPSLAFAYPELVNRNCASCHSEASGFGILTAAGKNYSFNSAHKKTESYFEIKAPEWLLLGAKADLTQVFTETPYEKNGSFKATRAEVQLGLSQAIDTYLSVSAQGSLNRVEPENKSDSISDYVYSPYRFVELRYSENGEESLTAKHGFYRNEWQNDLSLFETSFQQSEFSYVHDKYQVSLGYISKIKNYNTSTSMNDGFINYKFLQPDRYNILLGHQWGEQSKLTSLALTFKKNEQLTIRTLLAQTITSGVEGVKARLMPIYQMNSFLKFFCFADYQNVNIKTAKPRTIHYGMGSDYLLFPQGLLSVIYSKIDDSMLNNNPVQKFELNFHIYM